MINKVQESINNYEHSIKTNQTLIKELTSSIKHLTSGLVVLSNNNNTVKKALMGDNEFRVDQRIKIDTLKSRSELNNTLATIICKGETFPNTYHIKCDLDEQIICVQGRSITIISESEVTEV